ncbi:hypothetical protein LSAT2_024606 [Lamellibrachia satsuma]|nr:hypothetical protein LSAT2_024606 [Lamellibrachia satsuma]
MRSNYCFIKSKRDTNRKLTELVQISDEKVTVGFSGTTVQESFGNYGLKSPNWYFLTFTWSADSGNLEVRRNGIRIARISSYAKGQTLPEYGWIVLGCQYGTDSNTCKDGAGFDGYISRVEVWNRVLSSSSEILKLTEGRTNAISTGRTLRWTGYLTFAGVQIIHPSTASDAGQTDAKPTRITCPDTFHVTNSDRQVLVKWPEPTTTGKLAGSARSVYANDRVYLWGRYRNTYVVYDKDGNADTCSFDVFVRSEYHTCAMFICL